MERWGITFPLDGVPLPAHREVLREAETLGYTDAWTAETDGPDAFAPCVLASAWTDKLRLGTAIANVFTRGPALLAQQAIAASEAAPGRFCLGIGSSSPAIVENWNGLDFERPFTRVRETLAFLRDAFSGDRAKSEALGVRGFRMGRRFADPPPIFVAALREKMLSLAGSSAEGVVINWLSADNVPQVVDVAKAAAKEAGRDPDALEVVCRIFVIPGGNEEMARFVARRAISGYMTTPVYRDFQRWLGRGKALRPMQEAWHAGDRSAANELVPDKVIEELFVMGDRKACLDQIEAYVRNGVTVPVINFMPTAVEPKELAERNIAAMRELVRG